MYLTYAYYRVRDGSGWQSFCDVSSRFSCDAVTASDFSAVAGVPIAWAAALFYAAVTWMAWRVLRRRRLVVPTSPGLALVAAGSVASAASIALAGLSVHVIGVLCPLCLVLYGCNASLLVLGVVSVRRGAEPLARLIRAEVANLRRYVGRTGALLFAGLTLLVGLPVVQALAPMPVPAAASDLCDYVESRRARQDASTIRLVVYTDYQCPYCKKAEAGLATLRDAADVSVETRHYPLDKACNQGLQRTIHPGACLQAAAVICARQRGAELGRLIFEEGAASEAALLALATSLGMDATSYKACLASPETRTKLQADIDAARAAEVHGTPAIFYDGRRYRGPVDEEAFQCLLRN
jgi:protein-disulfide isomerase/uncharacterized membrane protein